MWLLKPEKPFPVDLESEQDPQSQYSLSWCVLSPPGVARSQRAEAVSPICPLIVDFMESTTVTNGPTFGRLSQLQSQLKLPVTGDICAL